ncbi:MAG: hypothetical protein HY879_27170 [Deltaproteobacteria bacterium]|nr:hypothetical protein [Deltaproteobacteria bacterium]
MKKIAIFFSVLGVIGLVSLVYAGSYRGSRYNPYDPNRNEIGHDQSPTQMRGPYQTYDLANPATPDPRTLTTPYGKDPRRWYDSQKDYQETYEKTVQDPRTLTSPYPSKKGLPYSSEELTSPYDEVIPQRPGKPATSQQLTPPAIQE